MKLEKVPTTRKTIPKKNTYINFEIIKEKLGINKVILKKHPLKRA